MIRIFNRYLPIRDTVYFVLENALILLFLMWSTTMGSGWPNLILVPLVVQVCLYYNELHPSFPRFSLKEFWVKHLQSILLAGGILFGIYLVTPVEIASTARFWKHLAFSPFILIGLRLGYQALVAVRQWETPVLIIGSGQVATLLMDTLSRHRNLGYRPVQFKWDLGAPDKLGEEWEKLGNVLGMHQVRKVVIALNDRRRQLPVEALLNLRVQGVEVIEGVSFYEQISGKILVKPLRPSSLIFSEGFNRMRIMHLSKRALDIFLASIGSIVSLPIFAILAVLIKLDSRGPIFYRQERVGEKGKTFMVIKFRSMRQDAETKTGPVWASENDPRVTRLGRIMRLLRLDEIPQMINVLKGEMSFVGPRPERPVFVDQLRKKIPYYDLRFTVKPGLTGWAQIKYQYGSTEEDALEKLQYDLYYIKHLSPFFDLTIVMETIQVILGGKGR
ncbi:MAG: TIGR03013 family PEP-CTERM/XrtA system glycosyltransferase [Candidatus Manganitrophus sp.]|nr:TIGR03013 family PEP-CTERM/XrtA system glycosyltransferase [Candidatus Manganitrophus sp.]WDT72724.1 MAG: TIGR03013 family PEP-CTERM/XrtA system glycosyltransferase [Candidatus Manganitrophus sp.]WDT79811.1 MAG: TIGR03013 family PEP-CTERM/XrtA system glycosyltransferase [Candidatus Manganitrophus sp.]